MDASFQFYGQLEYVDFSRNEMSHLPQRCFASQKKVNLKSYDKFGQVSISFIFININTFQLGFFFYLYQLLKLKMDGNKIANITNATFVGLKSLRSISLRDNILGSLQENLFVFLTKVRRLMYYQGNQMFIPIR